MTKFKVGDKVIYRGEQSVIVTTDEKYCKPSDCIVEYSNGWYRGNSVPSDYGYTKYDTYHFASFEDLELVEEQPTYKFKVGDRVKKINNDSWFKRGEILTIVSGKNDCWRCSNSEEQWYQCNDELELVEEESLLGAGLPFRLSLLRATMGSNESHYIGEPVDIGLYKSKNLSIKSGKTIMSILTTFVKNSLLSADEKALRQVGLKTDCGEYTQEAIDLVLQELCKEKEARLIEVANGLLAEDKKNK